MASRISRLAIIFSDVHSSSLIVTASLRTYDEVIPGQIVLSQDIINNSRKFDLINCF